MSRLQFLLFDANVVFHLFENGFWDTVIDKFDVTLSRIVAEREVKYYRGTEYDEIIDLKPLIDAGKIKVLDANPTDVTSFKERFSEQYLEKLDPGESESLCILLQSSDPYIICSSDAIVFKVLGALNRSEEGKSLEELLQMMGLQRKVPSQFTKDFRLRYTRLGQREKIQGLVFK